MSAARRKQNDKKAKQAGKAVVLGGLLIVLAFVVVNHLMQGDGPPSKAAAQSPTDSTGGTTASARSGRETVHVAVTSDLRRDLFTFDRKDYERLDGDEPVATESAPGSEELIAEVRSVLNVQATAGGDSPRALINGQWHDIGDKVKGFTLVEIEQRSIVVQRGGVRVRLSM